MNPIRPHDLVRLRHTPSWRGMVTVVEGDEAWVMQTHMGDGFASWVPVDFLELVPGQMEELVA